MRTAFGLVLAVSLGTAVADEPDPVLARLDAAMDKFRDEMKAYREKGTNWLDAREAAARKAGDKKAVDRIKDERAIFERTDELANTANEELRRRPAAARARLTAVYTAAMKDYVRAREDKKAAGLERDLAWVKIGISPTEPRKLWVHDRGEYKLIARGRWQEIVDKQICGHKWIETERTNTYVELHSTVDGRTYTVRLSAERADYTANPPLPVPTYYGKWVE